MVFYVPGTEEKDSKKVIMSLQQAHENTATNTTDIATNTADIATNTADIATNTADIATNTADISALQALQSSRITASLGADVALSSGGSYFDGPSVAQGTSGTWFASGTVTLTDTAGGGAFRCKLWDGTTVIASGIVNAAAASAVITVSLSGVLTSPAGNIRISVRNTASGTGKILFNATGESKDSTITAFRLA